MKGLLAIATASCCVLHARSQSLPLLVSGPPRSAAPTAPNTPTIPSYTPSNLNGGGNTAVSSSYVGIGASASSSSAVAVTESKSDKGGKSATAATTASGSDSDASSRNVNVTLARMPDPQEFCKDMKEISSGSTLNVTWLSKGRYSSNLYVRYASDAYNNWVSVPAFPPFSGRKRDGEEESDDDEEKDDPTADYIVSYQHTVQSYQKGIMFTIGQFDGAKDATVATLNSKKIKIVSECIKRKDGLAAGETETETGTEDNDSVDQDEEGIAELADGEAAELDESTAAVDAEAAGSLDATDTVDVSAASAMLVQSDLTQIVGIMSILLAWGIAALAP